MQILKRIPVRRQTWPPSAIFNFSCYRISSETSWRIWMKLAYCVRLNVVRTYYKCEKFVRVLHRTEVKDSHVWKIRTNSSQVWQIRSNFSHLWQIRLTFTFERICHTCEEFAHICHTWKNAKEFFTSMTNTCELFTRLKLDICEKLVPIKISKLVERIFHIYQNVTYSCE